MHLQRTPCILITVDCLRVDHVGCFGYKQRTTPNIDRLAQDSIIFTNAFSNGPYTTSSFPSIFTSTILLRYKGEDLPLSPERPTLTETLQKNGYSTAAFHSNPYLSSGFGYNRGFDYFEDFGAEPIGKEERIRGLKGQIHGFLADLNNRILTTLKAHRMDRTVLSRVFNLLSFYYTCLVGYSGARADGATITKKAISWLSKNPSSFIWLHYMDVHGPYIPPRKHRDKFCSERISFYQQAKALSKRETPESVTRREVDILIDLYDASVYYVDECIGTLISQLKAMKIYENCLIIIAADHGEEFTEHTSFSHGCKLYDELLHIPLIIKLPDSMSHQEVKGLCSLIDLAPTILDILKIPRDISFDGTSLLSMVERKSAGRPWVIGACGNSDEEGKKKKLFSLRTEKWKYIFKEGMSDELYNLQTDPKEKENLAKTCHEIREKLKSKLIQLSSKVYYDLPSTPSVLMDKKMKMRLKALGYS